MYRAFRDNKQSLPGENEILNTQVPSVKVYLYPFKTDQPILALPKLAAPQLVLQKILPMETLKKYLASKFQGVAAEDIQLLFKNQNIPDNFKLQDCEKQYGFSENKNIIHYMRRDNYNANPNPIIKTDNTDI
jgi:hypothetical protein